MEDGHVRAKVDIEQTERSAVLILIVVEDGHVRLQLARVYVNMDVLILIVVEDGHVLAQVRVNVESNARLNPYCSGRWSRTTTTRKSLR